MRMNIPDLFLCTARVIVISDAHANIGTVETLLGEVNFTDADTLAFLGDIVQKGYNNIFALKRFHELFAHKSNVIFLLGNHEVRLS